MVQVREDCDIMNNEEKNTYVKKQITDAMLNLLKNHEFEDIPVSLITSTANVSRNSFYRNYESKEDILLGHIKRLLLKWDEEYKKQDVGSNASLYGSLFGHLSDNRDFYLLLKKRGLFHFFLTVLLELSGPKPEHNNMWAYTTAFIAYGTFGWIEEWIGRGMQESAETMTALLSMYGMT